VNAVLDLSVKPDTDLAGPVRIRRANGEDADAVRALVFGVLQCYGLRPDPETTDKDLDDLEGHYFNAPASRLKKSCRGVKSNFYP